MKHSEYHYRLVGQLEVDKLTVKIRISLETILHCMVDEVFNMHLTLKYYTKASS
jgi:hypothetical protein